MTGQRILTWVAHIVAIAVGVLFVKEGIQKLMGDANALAPFTDFSWPIWFAYTIGVIEVAGAALLIFPKTRIASAVLLAAVMIGAAATNIANGNADYIWLNITLFVALLFLVGQRQETLRNAPTG
ncbi:DoxX family protein [Micrococcoides hystricis]|uniref:DoxX family protein n=1 Tax=Micrococcoides hystricis TaxID=1572761 RepID=A0ABV6PBG8_9MICC